MINIVKDKEIFSLIDKYESYLNKSINLIGSGNIFSNQIREVLLSGIANVIAEGYIGKRYHAGCEIFDEIEKIAIERGRKLFKAKDINVQPHSGSQANQAVILGLLKKGDKILSLSIRGGGHITHNKISFLSEIFEIYNYSVDPKTYLLNYKSIESVAKKVKPQLIICGASAYPRRINFKKFREIADKVGAFLLADIAHISGIIAANLHPSPIDFADVSTSSTYKTIRGPHGGIIIYGKRSSDEIIKKINRAITLRLQSALHSSNVAAKAVCFYEALTPEFVQYQRNILLNANTIAKTLLKNNINIITGGTDNHLVLIDLRKTGINGKELQEYLENINILTNKNLIPFDTSGSEEPSGLRLGTSTFTTTGYDERDAEKVSEIISFVIKSPNRSKKDIKSELRLKVRDITERLRIHS